jgi:hypothetical protein
MPPAPDDPILSATLALLEARLLGTAAPAPGLPDDKMADLQSHGTLVLGDWVPFASRDWSRQRCTVHIGARETVERTGTHPLGVLGAAGASEAGSGHLQCGRTVEFRARFAGSAHEAR